MTSKKFLALATAIFAVFAFTGVAMAANRIEVKATSEPINAGSTCDKAGGFSLEFDTGTVLTEGDQIIIDLPVKPNGAEVRICKDIDLEISMGSENGYTAGVDPVPTGTGHPLYFVEDTTSATGVGATTGDIYLTVKGTATTQRITIDVVGLTAGTGNDFITVGPDDDDKLVLVILDQKINTTDFVNPTTQGGLWIDATSPADGIYETAAAKGDNTLCIDVSDWDESTVDASMDSKDDKYTFIPTNPEIAHIAKAAAYAFEVCEKVDLEDRTNCGEKGVQAIDTCTYFDYETRFGYVTTTGTGRVIISTTETNFPITDYQIQLDILVNGSTGDHGVYWSNQAVRADGFPSLTDACNTTPSSMPDAGAQASYTYWNGSGGTLLATNIETPHTAAVGSCDVADVARAVSLRTNAATLSIVSGDDYMMIDLPAFNYDIDDITADDEVSVQLTLIKAPCGTIFTGTIDVATLCPLTVVPTTMYTLIYPYYTAMTGDLWWDGFVVTNLSGASGLYTAIVYEQDGDVGVFTGSVDPNSLDQATLADKLAGATLAVGTGSGTLGDSLCYIVVCTDFMADGFAFMGSLSTNTLMANESMGYLPRVVQVIAVGTTSYARYYNLCATIMGTTLPGSSPF